MTLSARSMVFLFLSIFAVASLIVGCSGQDTTSQSLATSNAAVKAETEEKTLNATSENTQYNLPDRVDVVYFQSGKPCHCMAVIGENIQSIVIFDFLDEYSEGKLTFTLLDSSDEANYEMAMKYNTGPFGLFITIVQGETERIVPVEELWSMTGNEEKYKAYVKDIIARSLKGEM